MPGSRVRVKAHHYVRLEADRDRIELTAIDVDGNVLDRHSIIHAARSATVPIPSSEAFSTGIAIAAMPSAAITSWVIAARLRG